MGKPYSIDLRERAVAAVLKEGLSRHELAARFGVAPVTIMVLFFRLESIPGLPAVARRSTPKIDQRVPLQRSPRPRPAHD